MILPTPDMLGSNGCGLGEDGQARTSTIWPLKISNAFWISGSFLKSSLLGVAGPDLALVGGSAVSLLALAGLSVAPGESGWDTGPVAGGVAAPLFTGDSAFTN